MLQRTKPKQLDEYFVDLSKRTQPGVFFCRLNGYNSQIHAFIQAYYQAARTCGVIIEGKLPNPDNNNLAYYEEMMGMDFQLNVGFFADRLKKWLPRMNVQQRQAVSEAVYDTLAKLQAGGKNQAMLKNAYIKFMCWLYYKFERIVNCLGAEKLPKILYEGSISRYELLLFQVLSQAGCDIVLLQYQGDAAYLQLDPQSEQSDVWDMPEQTAFPASFRLKNIQQELQQAMEEQRLYGTLPQHTNCTNAWLTGDILQDVKTDCAQRGTDTRFFYNCFVRINGAEDKLTYSNTLYELQLDLKHSGKNVVIVNQRIAPPTVEEIGRIQRTNRQDMKHQLFDLSANIRWQADTELQRILNKAFLDVCLEEGRQLQNNINRLTNKAVYLLCWLKRFEQQLFHGWDIGKTACFLFLGACDSANEALFFRFLARLPVDVILFHPDTSKPCCVTDKLLYEVNYSDSLILTEYPTEETARRAGTAAYHAERELDTLMYQDSGLYRSQQYQKAAVLSLQTMYEEIAILWDQELKYRPNFEVQDNVVTVPVIFAKVSGVKNADVSAYWNSIKKLNTADTEIIASVPHLTRTTPNPIKPFAAEFWRNGRLQRGKLKQHKAYPYGFLREPMQEYLLDVLEQLIERKYIRGTFENGTEYTILSTALNLEKTILRMIQKFDFTKKNPKLIYVVTGESGLSLEDAVTTAFLHLIGFDIVFFVPTGYQCVEQYFNENLLEEHQIGEYLYDLHIPDLNAPIPGAHSSWREKFFKRGM